MIQIDIPMPKNCGECPVCNELLMCGVPCNGRGWGENDVRDYFSQGRPEWCPLKEQEAQKFFVDESGKITPLPVVVRCKDCKHRPKKPDWETYEDGGDIEFPDGKCPCQCSSDRYYSWYPDDDWFCADGERE